MATPRERSDKLLQRAYDDAPASVELAQWVSIAVSVEPHLLRRARLKLAPHIDAGAESDLWFGPLVSSRSTSAVVLDRGVATVLREALAAEEKPAPDGRHAIDAARAIVVAAHHHLAHAIQVEETIIYRALRGDDDAAIDDVLQQAVSAMRRDEQSAAAVARWADRALLGLPARVRTFDSARELAANTITRLGLGTRLLREVDDVRLPKDWKVPGASGTVSVGARLAPQSLRFVEAADSLGATIVVPKTPLLVDVSWTDAKGVSGGRAVVPAAGQTVTLPSGFSSVSVRTADGRVYNLSTEAVTDTAPAASEPATKRYRVAAVALIEGARLDFPKVPLDSLTPNMPARVRPILLDDPSGGERVLILRWSASADWPPHFVMRGVDAALTRASDEEAQKLELRWSIPVMRIAPNDSGRTPTPALVAPVAARLTWNDDRSIDDHGTYTELLQILPGGAPNLGARVPFGDIPHAIRIHTSLGSDITAERASDLARRAVAIAEADCRVWHIARERGEESLVVSTSAVAEAWTALTRAVNNQAMFPGLPAIPAGSVSEIAPKTFSTASYDTPDVMLDVLSVLVEEFIRLGCTRRVSVGDYELLHFPDLFAPVEEVRFDGESTRVVSRGRLGPSASTIEYQELALRLAGTQPMTPVQVGRELTQFSSGDGTFWIRLRGETIELLVPRGLREEPTRRIADAFGELLRLVSPTVAIDVFGIQSPDFATYPASNASPPAPIDAYVSVATADRGPELTEFLAMLIRRARINFGLEIRLLGYAEPRLNELPDRSAIFAANILIAIVTDRYVESEYCLAELAAFAERVRQHAPQSARCIYPVLWEGRLRAGMPPHLRQFVAIDPTRYGVEIEGGFHKMFGRERDSTERVMDAIARDLVTATADFRLEPDQPPAQTADTARARQLDEAAVLELLNSLALAFHVGRLDGDAKDSDARQSLYTDQSESDVADFWHVRSQCEYVFAGPVSDYLIHGDADPFDVDEDASLLRLQAAIAGFGESEGRRQLQLEGLLQIAEYRNKNEVKDAESILGMSLGDAAALVGRARSANPKDRAPLDRLLPTLESREFARAMRYLTASGPSWFDASSPATLRKCRSLPQYVEELTNLWLKYAARGTRRLGDAWIEMSFKPESLLEAFSRRFPQIDVQHGEEHKPFFGSPPPEPEFAWAVRANQYGDAVAQLRDIAVPSLRAEQERRAARRAAASA